jgi:hypothetical protein
MKGKQSASSPAKSSASSPFKIAKSPAKKHKSVPTRTKKIPLTISSLGFGEPFSFEIYLYEKGLEDDAFTYGLSKYIRGNEEEVHEIMDTLNFTQVLSRRVPMSDDVIAKNNSNSYDRLLFLRYPQDGVSTSTTRAAGMLGLKNFLMDKRFTKYPPTFIETVDLSDYDTTNPTSMDHYLLNKDIEQLLKQDLDELVLDDDFKKEFPDVAKLIWTGKHVGDFGRTLGF